MPDWNLVRIRVKSMKAPCECGHKVGDEWIVGRRAPEGLCIGALENLLPYIRTLAFNGTFPWATDELDVGTFSCPGPDNPVLYEVKRLPDLAEPPMA